MSFSPQNTNEESLIDFIKDKEVHDFAENIKYKKRIITIAVVTAGITLCGISLYILPDFLSEDHKNKMTYSANMSTEHKSLQEQKKQNINSNTIHGSAE